MVLLVCGLANAADAVEILSVGLLGAAAQDDLNVRFTVSRCVMAACIAVSLSPRLSTIGIARLSVRHRADERLRLSL